MKSRIALYVVFGTINIILWKLLGFEFVVLVALGQIIGELTYKEYEQEENRKNNKKSFS